MLTRVSNYSELLFYVWMCLGQQKGAILCLSFVGQKAILLTQQKPGLATILNLEVSSILELFLVSSKRTLKQLSSLVFRIQITPDIWDAYPQH